MYVGLWGLGTYERMTGPLPDCRAVLCDNIEFSAGDVEVLNRLNLPAFVNHQVWHSLEIPYSLGIFLIAGLIFRRRSDHTGGLLLSFTLVYVGAILFSGADDPLRRAYPGLRPLVSLLDVIGMASLILVLLVFPDGRMPGKRRPLVVAGLIITMITIPLLSGGSSRLQGPEIPPLATALWILLFVALIVIGLHSQVHRYRYVSTGIQRQQTKWVVFGLSGYLAVVLLWGYIGYAYPPSEPSPARVGWVLVATPLILGFSSLVPITVAFAILRYRLFDIDRLINRALVYTILTGLLALAYLAGVVVLQQIFALLGVGQAPIAVVLSTLGIARLFNPLRRQVQAFIDRRFYRRRYDLARTLAAFGSQMREELEVDYLMAELFNVTAEALQPEHLSLWIREPQAESVDSSLASTTR
jgi:hypothetical protein